MRRELSRFMTTPFQPARGRRIEPVKKAEFHENDALRQ